MSTTPKKNQSANTSTAALEHERLTALINSMADAVIAVDELQKVVIYNGAALNILNINKNLNNKKIHTLLHLLNKNNQINRLI